MPYPGGGGGVDPLIVFFEIEEGLRSGRIDPSSPAARAYLQASAAQRRMSPQGSPNNRAQTLLGDPIRPIGNPGAVTPGMAGGGPPVQNPGMTPGPAGGGPPIQNPYGGPFSGPAGPGYSGGFRPNPLNGGMGGGGRTGGHLGTQNYLDPRTLMGRPQTGGPMNYTRPQLGGPDQYHLRPSDRMNPSQAQPVAPGSYSGARTNPAAGGGAQGQAWNPFAMQAFHNAVRDRNEMRRSQQRSPGNMSGGRSGLNGGRPPASNRGYSSGY